MHKRDADFIRDLYNFSWYNRHVAVLASYEVLADVSRLYGSERTADSLPPVEAVRVQKILRAKIFSEFMALLEAFGVLSLAIRARRERSMMWSYLNVEPQEVTQFFNIVLQGTAPVPLQSLLKLPSPKAFDRAVGNDTSGKFAGLKFPTKPYEAIAANIRIIAETYRGAQGLNVKTYNKLKHAFVCVEGTGWITSDLPDDGALVLVDETEALSGNRVGLRSLSLTQADLDLEITNVIRITEMGAELLALVLALESLGLLYK